MVHNKCEVYDCEAIRQLVGASEYIGPDYDHFVHAWGPGRRSRCTNKHDTGGEAESAGK